MDRELRKTVCLWLTIDSKIWTEQVFFFVTEKLLCKCKTLETDMATVSARVFVNVLMLFETALCTEFLPARGPGTSVFDWFSAGHMTCMPIRTGVSLANKTPFTYFTLERFSVRVDTMFHETSSVHLHLAALRAKMFPFRLDVRLFHWCGRCLGHRFRGRSDYFLCTHIRKTICYDTGQVHLI